jgi:hypothetical protein
MRFFFQSMLRSVKTAGWQFLPGRMLAVAMIVLMLAACSNDSGTPDDRRFANDPAETQEAPTATIAASPSATVATTSQPVASPATVLKTRGAPSTFYLLVDGQLVATTVGGAETTQRTWKPADGAHFAAIDAAPDGSRVAAIEVPDDGAGSVDLVVFDQKGEAIFQASRVIDLATALATPISDGTSGAAAPELQVFVSWPASGNRVLVGSVDGQLRSIPLDGSDPVRFEPESLLVGLQWAQWSPNGSQIAALVRDTSGNGRIVSLKTDGATLTSKDLVASDSRADANSIEQVDWAADGASVFYVATNRDQQQPDGGQLYQQDLATGRVVLLATAGRAGPSGLIAGIDVSPDGRSIAYVVAVRDGSDQRFHSLIVKSLKNGLSYDVPVSMSAVPGVAWVPSGLVCDVTTRDGVQLILAEPDGAVSRLQPEVVGATPVAEGTPEVQATPVEGATPEAAG